MWTPIIYRHRSVLENRDECQYLVRYEILFSIFMFLGTIGFQSHAFLIVMTLVDFCARQFFREWHRGIVTTTTTRNPIMDKKMCTALNLARLFSQSILYGETALLILINYHKLKHNNNLFIFIVLMYQCLYCAKRFIDVFTLQLCDLHDYVNQNIYFFKYDYGMITSICLALTNGLLIPSTINPIHVFMLMIILHSRGSK